MALLTKKEFAAKCGMETKKLSVYISRSKVIINENQMIDDQNPANIQFIEHSHTMGQRVAPEKQPKERKPSSRKTTVKEKVDRKVDQDKLEKYNKKFDLDSQKREVEIEKIQTDIEIQKIKRLRHAGKLVPTDMVKAVIAKYFKNVTIEYKQSVDTIVTIFAKKTKMHINDKAEMKTQLVRVINEAVENSINLTKKELGVIISESSEA